MAVTLAGLAVDQPVQEVEDVGLGGNAGLQRQFDGAEDRLLVVLQHQRQDLDHLPVAAGVLEQDGPATAGTLRAAR